MPIQIHPSILNADHAHMQSEFDRIKAAGADGIHLDIMDGRFVEPVTFDLDTIRRYVQMIDLPFDAHLMIVEPERHVDEYVDAGASLVNFHLEVTDNPGAIIDHLHGRGVKAGVTINPDTPVDGVLKLAGKVELVLFMSVFPGYGGQKFIPGVLDKVRELRRHYEKSGLETPMVQIDGGINLETAPLAVAAGVNNLVVGTFIFRSPDYAATIGSLRRACEGVALDWK
ncbi:ribulose-phosphate 3-epimerase [bacterium]|nr:ribulose-phosphate 3-epimerase [bacterium]